ncbi:unnamed protein product, partial [marine sediment metagenome]
MEELKEILKGIEKSLNTLANGQAVIAKALTEDTEDDDILNLGKAGAKYSSANLGRLKAIRDSINSLLAGFD